jgi:hypothetical protein
VVENPLVVLYLADRTLVEVEWQVPLVRFNSSVMLSGYHLGLFIPWFMKGMLRT